MPGRMGEDGVRSLPEHLKEAENRQAASVSGAACRVVMNEWPDLLFGLFLLGSGFGGLGCRFCGLGGFFRRAFVDGVPGPVPFVHVHGAGGQKRYGSVQVVFVSHFNNLVHIAGGYGNSAGNGAARIVFLYDARATADL